MFLQNFWMEQCELCMRLTMRVFIRSCAPCFDIARSPTASTHACRVWETRMCEFMPRSLPKLEAARTGKTVFSN